jgi:uncharacterized SAM-binding protein YcdF (DUF218 family)
LLVSKRRRIITKVLLACILIWPFAAWLGARLLIIQAPLEQADAIVVLSGSANYRERAREAARILLHGGSKRILLTNDNARGPWSTAKQSNPLFYERSFNLLKKVGVPENSIEVLPQPVTSTNDEAEVVRQYAKEHGLRSVLVVTSAYHSRRAFWTFSRVFRDSGIQIGLISASTGGESPRPATWWLTERGWKLVPTEYVKFIYYVIKYR